MSACKMWFTGEPPRVVESFFGLVWKSSYAFPLDSNFASFLGKTVTRKGLRHPCLLALFVKVKVFQVLVGSARRSRISRRENGNQSPWYAAPS